MRPLLAALVCAVAVPLPGADWWQLHATWDAGGLRIREANPIAPMEKVPTTPGLRGAPVRFDYDAEWLDAAGRVIAKGAIAIPAGVRTSAPGQPCVARAGEDGFAVLRVEGPALDAEPASIRLALRDVCGSALLLDALPSRLRSSGEVAIESIRRYPAAHRDGPVSATKLRDTGSDGSRLVLAFLGDGYTQANLNAGTYANHIANQFLNAFESRSPWDVYFAGTNVYRVDVASNQEGADRTAGPSGPLVDTYFNATFWSFGIDRLLTIDATGQSRAIAAANAMIGPGVWDHAFVVVNSAVYGGSGGPVPVASVDPFASDVMVHEFGHSFAGLADEYEDPYPGYPPGDSEPNVDFNGSGSGLKWLAWVENGTPLPTPETGAFFEAIGAYEGARYLTSGIFRPHQACGMRYLGFPFCSVCKEAHVQAYFRTVPLVESVDPPPGNTAAIAIGTDGLMFGVATNPNLGHVATWLLGGSPIPGEDEPTILLRQEFFSSTAPTQLKLRIDHATSLVRLAPIAQELTWTVRAEALPNPIVPMILGEAPATGGDANSDGVVDAADLL